MFILMKYHFQGIKCLSLEGEIIKHSFLHLVISASIQQPNNSTQAPDAIKIITVDTGERQLKRWPLPETNAIYSAQSSNDASKFTMRDSRWKLSDNRDQYCRYR